MDRLTLGTAQFGLRYGITNKNGQVPVDEVKSIIKFAIENGISTLDTAKAYGNSELCLGHVGVSRFNVITKLPPLPENCKDLTVWVFNQLDDSLKKLRLNQVYGLLLHRSSDLMQPFGKALYEALTELKRKCLIKKMGISIYSPGELDIIVPRYALDIVQAPFNVFDRRMITSGWLKRLFTQGIELHVRSVFLQGLLLAKGSHIHQKFSKWQPLFTMWNNWLRKNNVLAIEAALKFALSFPEISKAVVGAENLFQLSEIIRAANHPFTHEFPSFSCDDEGLLNPTQWNRL